MVAPVIGAALISSGVGLFAASRAEKRENARFQQARDDSFQQARDDRAALVEQREYDLAAYNMQRADALSDNDQQFVRLRAAAEKAAFNPLAVLNGFPAAGQVQSVGLPSSSLSRSGSSTVGYIPPTDYVGGAMGDAAMMIGNALASSPSMSANKKLNDLQRSNTRLSSALRDATIRPKVAGVYSKPETPRFGLGVAQGAGEPVPMPEVYLDRQSGYYSGGQFIPGALGFSPNTVHQTNNGEAIANIRGVTDYVLALPQQSRAISDNAGWTKPGENYRDDFVPIPGTTWSLPIPKGWFSDFGLGYKPHRTGGAR